MLIRDPLLDLSIAQDGLLYDMRHVSQFLQYVGQEMQLQLVVVEARPLYTIAKYSEKQENNRQKIILMLGSKNLGGLYNFLSPYAN